MRRIEGVECQVAREALSARLDDERQHVPASRVDDHLESCAACRQWLSETVELARRTRRTAIDAVPDLSDRILASADPAGRRHRFSAARVLRYALLVVCVAELSVAIAHLSASSAWSVALGGFFLVVLICWAVVRSGKSGADTDAEIVLPAGASRGQRRARVRPVDAA